MGMRFIIIIEKYFFAKRILNSGPDTPKFCPMTSLTLELTLNDPHDAKPNPKRPSCAYPGTYRP